MRGELSSAARLRRSSAGRRSSCASSLHRHRARVTSGRSSRSSKHPSGRITKFSSSARRRSVTRLPVQVRSRSPGHAPRTDLGPHVHAPARTGRCGRRGRDLRSVERGRDASDVRGGDRRMATGSHRPGGKRVRLGGCRRSARRPSCASRRGILPCRGGRARDRNASARRAASGALCADRRVGVPHVAFQSRSILHGSRSRGSAPRPPKRFHNLSPTGGPATSDLSST